MSKPVTSIEMELTGAASAMLGYASAFTEMNIIIDDPADYLERMKEGFGRYTKRLDAALIAYVEELADD